MDMYKNSTEIIPRSNKIKKTVFDPEKKEWIVKEYIQIDNKPTLIGFLIKTYPLESGYMKSWWQTRNTVVMTEKIYIHWKLCE
jgi:hypothetical protein